MHEQPVLDLAYLRSITDGNSEMEKEFFDLFYQTAARCRRQLSHNMMNHQPQPWDEAAHELKGAASYLGARRIQQLCHEARNAPPETRAALLTQLDAELQALNDYVKGLRYAS